MLKALEKGKIELPSLSSKLFFDLLWRNTEEGFFADPMYGGNRDKVGWKLIGFPGVPSGAYNEHLDKPEPYRAEPVSILDIQTEAGAGRCAGLREAHHDRNRTGGNNVTTTKLKPVDAVVVGSGVVGSIMSHGAGERRPEGASASSAAA